MRNKGNATIEYVLFLPIFTVTLLLLIHFGLQMVRMATLQQIADESAEALARTWMTDDNANMATMLQNGSYNADHLTRRERYWWLNALMLSGGKLREAEKSMLWRLENQAIFGSSSSQNQSAFDAKILYKPILCGGELTVHLSWQGNTLFGDLLSRFGMQKQSVLSVQAVAQITDPREFINNTDYVLQLLQKTKLGRTVSSNIIEPIQNSIRKISEE